MNLARCRTFVFHLVFLAGLFLPGPGFTQSGAGSGRPEVEGSIVIKSDSLEIDNTQKLVTFTGNVDARQEDFRINCRKMVLYYLERSGEKGTGKGGTRIDRIIAEGEVKITRTEGGVATAEKAVYHQAEDKLILTGNPVVKQGDDFVEGTRIILFLKEKRSIVEGSKDRKVRAVLFPRDEKR